MRARHWQLQAANGLAFVPVGDFAWYDQILEWTTLLGAVPARFGQKDNESVSLDTLFRMGRGRAPSGARRRLRNDQVVRHQLPLHRPRADAGPDLPHRPRIAVRADQGAQALGLAVKPVIPGPLTWLYLGKGDAYADGAADAGKLKLLENLLPVYQAVLARCAQQGVQWAQIDEPILALDLPQAWRDAFKQVYAALSSSPLKLLVATYFDGLKDNLPTALALPVAGLHVDLVRAPEQLAEVVAGLRADQVLSAGVINGRNIWRTDLDAAAAMLAPIKSSWASACGWRRRARCCMCLWTWTMKPNSMPS